MPETILACDAGGTKTRLAFFSNNGGNLKKMTTETYLSKQFSTIEEIIQKFLDENDVRIQRACIGVPGPVSNGQAHITNLPWNVNQEEIKNKFSFKKVKLVNDLVATTASLPHLKSDDMFVLHNNKQRQQNDAVYGVVAPGTGLGQGYLYQISGENYILASEGGHADFAPTSAIEIDLLKYLQKRYGRVSYERLLSGPGLVNIYDFLKEAGYYTEPEELTLQFKKDDPAKVISTYALENKYEICKHALDIFVSVLGAQAGNLVLNLMISGMFLGGGIIPKIHKKLIDGSILKSYLNKGRLSSLVAGTPLYIIRCDHAALLGAAWLLVKDGFQFNG